MREDGRESLSWSTRSEFRQAPDRGTDQGSPLPDQESLTGAPHPKVPVLEPVQKAVQKAVLESLESLFSRDFLRSARLRPFS